MRPGSSAAARCPCSFTLLLLLHLDLLFAIAPESPPHMHLVPVSSVQHESNNTPTLGNRKGNGPGRCLLMSNYPDEYANLQKRAATNFWHTFMAVTVPLAAAMQTRGRCRCQPLNHSRRCYNGSASGALVLVEGVPAAHASCVCDCVELIRPPASAVLLSKQLVPLANVVSIISNESVHNASDRVRRRVVHIKRCDTLLPNRATHAAERGAKSYLEACGLERPWLKVRQLYGAFAGMDFECGHALGPALALFIPREKCATGNVGAQVHHAICLKASAPKLQRARSLLEKRGWRTTVQSFDELPLVQQMRAVAAASIVVYGHGAALSNMLWARPGTVIVEITPYMSGKQLSDMHRFQSVTFHRNMFQKLGAYLQQVGVAVRHLAIPAAREPNFLGGSDCHEWGCYSSQHLVELMLETREALLDYSETKQLLGWRTSWRTTRRGAPAQRLNPSAGRQEGGPAQEVIRQVIRSGRDESSPQPAAGSRQPPGGEPAAEF